MAAAPCLHPNFLGTRDQTTKLTSVVILVVIIVTFFYLNHLKKQYPIIKKYCKHAPQLFPEDQVPKPSVIG